LKKVTLTSLALTLFLLHSFGQINVGIKAALNVANVKNLRSDATPRVGFNGGVFTQINLTKKVILQPAILFSSKGHKYPANQFSAAGRLQLNYIAIPLMAGFKPGKKMLILIGPEFSFLTNANSTFNGHKQNTTNLYRKFDLGIDVGATYTIKNGFGLELGYNYGFEDLMNVTFTDEYGNPTRKEKVGSNRVLQFGIFYIFKHK
jgi:hypothetical protein